MFPCHFPAYPAEEGWRWGGVGRVWVPCGGQPDAEPDSTSPYLRHWAQMRKLNVWIFKMGTLITPPSEACCISHDGPQKARITVPAVTIKMYVSLLLLLIKLGAMRNILYQRFVKARWRKINLN